MEDPAGWEVTRIRLTKTADVYINWREIGEKFLILFFKIQKDTEIMTVEQQTVYQEDLKNNLV